MTTQRIEKLSLGGIVHQHPVLDGNNEVGAIRTEAHVVDGIALGLIISFWNLPMQLLCVFVYVVIPVKLGTPVYTLRYSSHTTGY